MRGTEAAGVGGGVYDGFALVSASPAGDATPAFGIFGTGTGPGCFILGLLATGIGFAAGA